MQWPWQPASTHANQALEHRLTQIDQKLDWLMSATLLSGPQIPRTRPPLPPSLTQARPPLPPNYRKRDASDVWQASRHTDPAAALISPAPDPSLNSASGASLPVPTPMAGPVPSPTGPAPAK